MTQARVVLVTTPDEDTASVLVRLLVEEHLIACGSILPGVASIYRWEGEVHEERECLLLLKTDRSRIPALLGRIPEVHPYDVPEILALEVEAGHLPYLEWMARETQERRPKEL